ncbi:hypothetical protein [Methylocystis bryophila]|uniref:Uncharacterized protein n=1 Tax=Methylocystis bryophila TaxID=655015 RepID=A0A1W6MR22_9HYPH|nr:hypothetical protein [Methylocystis bryophila]ARN80060.1 hypothetical protein B1812_02030 [Methylocystis bryophila]BDV39978.1 hypothetical protein DSM21852_32310 [Methylocystis bryophila]
MSDNFFEKCGRDSVREKLRLSALMVVGLALGAFILGFMTTTTLTPKATLAGHIDVFSGRLVTGLPL